VILLRPRVFQDDQKKVKEVKIKIKKVKELRKENFGKEHKKKMTHDKASEITATEII
jgi:hypothetical protein